MIPRADREIDLDSVPRREVDDMSALKKYLLKNQNKVRE